MVEFWKIVEAMGGGFRAIVIAALGFISWRLWIESNRSKDERLADVKEHAKELREMQEAALSTVSASEKTIREALRELRRRQ